MKRGSISKVVADNVSAIRQRRQLTQQALADRLADLGRPMQSTAIAKIELGQRRVDVEDLVALAVALNVSPARLLLPDASGPRDPVQVTPALEVPMESAWQWASGAHSLSASDADLADPAIRRAELDFDAERPLWLRSMEEHPLYRAVMHLEWAVRRALDNQTGRSGRRSTAAKSSWLDSISRALEAVRSQIAELEEVGRP